MPEKMTWAVRVVPCDPEEGVQFFDEWEPFGATMDGDIMIRKQVMVEDDKSSVHHELTFAERYDR